MNKLIIKFCSQLLCICLLFGLSSCSTTQKIDQKTIFSEVKTALFKQQDDWNKADIEGFMQGYWKDPQMTFVGSSGVNYGWQTTLNNYKKNYPNKDAMGTLEFKVLEMKALAHNICYVIGQYTLIRKEDKPSGYFTLVWQKIDGQWFVISDHTS